MTQGSHSYRRDFTREMFILVATAAIRNKFSPEYLLFIYEILGTLTSGT